MEDSDSLKLNPGRVDPSSLSLRSQMALMELKRALAQESQFHAAQVTFDELKCIDYPPTVDVKVIYEQ